MPKGHALCVSVYVCESLSPLLFLVQYSFLTSFLCLVFDFELILIYVFFLIIGDDTAKKGWLCGGTVTPCVIRHEKRHVSYNKR